MSKRASSKYKIDRRLGCNLWGRPKSPYNRRGYGPGEHGQRRRKPTDFGTQLQAKQKLKGYYGSIGEKQFHRYYVEASRRRGDTGEKLIESLDVLRWLQCELNDYDIGQNFSACFVFQLCELFPPLSNRLYDSQLLSI